MKFKVGQLVSYPKRDYDFYKDRYNKELLTFGKIIEIGPGFRPETVRVRISIKDGNLTLNLNYDPEQLTPVIINGPGDAY